MYGALIKPHLKYAVGIWYLYLSKDILKLENVQRRTTKMAKRIKNLRYNEMLNIFGIYFLEWKRWGSITIFKFINGFDSVKLIKRFKININLQNKGLRHHKSQRKRILVKNVPSRYLYLLSRVAPPYNSLIVHIMIAKIAN